MKKILLSSLIAANILFASDAAYEIKPMIGYVDTREHVNLENHKVFGVGVARNIDNKYKLELGLLQSGNVSYESSSEDTKITFISFNGIKDYKLSDELKVYGLAGLGYEHISNSQYNNESDTFFNYGVGAAYALGAALSLNLDVRHELKFDGDKNVIYTLGISIPFGELNSKEGQIEEAPKTEVLTPTIVPDQKVLAEVVEKDTDNDGIIDSLDKCPTTQLNKIVDKDGCEVVTPVDLGIVFALNSHKIESSDIVKFEKFAKYLKTIPDAKVLLEAHTDSIGDADYNLQLSNKRANSAKKLLVSMGVDKTKITTVGYGETKPLVANDTAENQAKNRRVTAQIKN